VPERREHEGGVDRERRQQIEVADAPRRAGRLGAGRSAAEPRRPPQREGGGGRLGCLVGDLGQLLWNFE
jgi:hypothetical protein